MIVFADEDLAETVQRAAEGNSKLQLQVVSGSTKKDNQILLSEFQSSLIENPEVSVLESDDAEILYTSGTTRLA